MGVYLSADVIDAAYADGEGLQIRRGAVSRPQDADAAFAGIHVEIVVLQHRIGAAVYFHLAGIGFRPDHDRIALDAG